MQLVDLLLQVVDDLLLGVEVVLLCIDLLVPRLDLVLIRLDLVFHHLDLIGVGLLLRVGRRIRGEKIVQLGELLFGVLQLIAQRGDRVLGLHQHLLVFDLELLERDLEVVDLGALARHQRGKHRARRDRVTAAHEHFIDLARVLERDRLDRVCIDRAGQLHLRGDRAALGIGDGDLGQRAVHERV